MYYYYNDFHKCVYSYFVKITKKYLSTLLHYDFQRRTGNSQGILFFRGGSRDSFWSRDESGPKRVETFHPEIREEKYFSSQNPGGKVNYEDCRG